MNPKIFDLGDKGRAAIADLEKAIEERDPMKIGYHIQNSLSYLPVGSKIIEYSDRPIKGSDHIDGTMTRGEKSIFVRISVDGIPWRLIAPNGYSAGMADKWICRAVYSTSKNTVHIASYTHDDFEAMLIRAGI